MTNFPLFRFHSPIIHRYTYLERYIGQKDRYIDKKKKVGSEGIRPTVHCTFTRSTLPLLTTPIFVLHKILTFQIILDAIFSDIKPFS